MCKRIMKVKPNVWRVKKYDSANFTFRIYGYRKDPKGNKVCEYCFKKNKTEDKTSYLKKELPNICLMLEKSFTKDF